MTNTELKSIRKSLDLSKTDLARAIGISPVMEGKYEKGSKEIPEAVSQAVYELLDTMEEENATTIDMDIIDVDEEDISEVDEDATPAFDEALTEEEISTPVDGEVIASEAEEVTTPATDESSAEEITPASDEDQSTEEICASANEKTVAVAEKSPAEGKKNAPAVDASSEESDENTVNWGAAAIPFFLPPLMMTQYLFSIGYILSPKKRGFFGPWW